LISKELTDKQKYIDHWKNQATEDWKGADLLFAGKHYSLALFISHLVIEKICKALWIRDNVSDTPPKTHNLLYLLSKTRVFIPENIGLLIHDANRFQIEGRYEEYRLEIESLITEEFASQNFNSFKIIFTWIIKELE